MVKGVAVHIEIVLVDTVEIAGKAVIAIVYAVGVIAAAKERNALHMVDLAELLPCFLGDRVNAGGHAVILHLIRIIVLIELHNDGVIARADKAFLDLLVRAFDRGYDRDD